MLTTVAGLVLTTLISLIGIVYADLRENVKIILAALTVLGCVAATSSAWGEHKDDIRQQQELADLDVLNTLSGGARYYVQIAAGTQADLQEPLDRIDHEFGGAAECGMVAIRPPQSPGGQYKLVFGQNLDFTAAGLFQEFAMSHHLTPTKNSTQEVARIFREPDSPRSPSSREVRSSASAGCPEKN